MEYPLNCLKSVLAASCFISSSDRPQQTKADTIDPPDMPTILLYSRFRSCNALNIPICAVRRVPPPEKIGTICCLPDSLLKVDIRFWVKIIAYYSVDYGTLLGNYLFI